MGNTYRISFIAHYGEQIILEFEQDATETWENFSISGRDNKKEVIYVGRINPDNPEIPPYYVVDCSHRERIHYNSPYLANDRELCDWLRSFLYKYDFHKI